MTKDDKLFLAHAKKHLRGDYHFVMQEAKEAYQSHSRPSLAKRAANLVILAALKEIGQEHWRPSKGDEEEKRKAKKVPVTPVSDSGVKPRSKKWDGDSILDMADKIKQRA